MVARVVVTFAPSAGPANGERVVATCPTGEHGAPPDLRARARRQRFIASLVGRHRRHGRKPVLYVVVVRLWQWGDGEVYRGCVERGQLWNRAAFAVPVVEPCNVVDRRQPEGRVLAQVGDAKRHKRNKVPKHWGWAGGRVNTPSSKRGARKRGEDSRKVVVSQEIGTRMVMDAQIESGTPSPHNRGGPLNVTNMLAAVTVMVNCIFSLAMTHPGKRGKRSGRTYLQYGKNSCPSTFKPHIRC